MSFVYIDTHNELKQCRWHGIITYNSKQIQVFSRTLEIGAQRSLVSPTQASCCRLIEDSLLAFEN